MTKKEGWAMRVKRNCLSIIIIHKNQVKIIDLNGVITIYITYITGGRSAI